MSSALGEENVKQCSTSSGAIEYSKILPVRSLFRENGYLLQPLQVEVDHCSIDGKNHLDKELVHFTSEAKEIRDCYRSAFINKTDNPKKIIFVTGSEREESESVVNCTKAEIERNISSH